VRTFEGAEVEFSREAGHGVTMADSAEEAYLCSVLGLVPSEVERLDMERVQYLLGYAEGRTIAEWMAHEEASKAAKRR